MRRVWVAALVAAMVGIGVPASADVQRFELNITPSWYDLSNDLVVLINIDRETLCTDEVVAFEEALADWIAGGLLGEPPAEPEFAEGFSPVAIQRPELSSGAVVSLGRADALYIELWTPDHAEEQLGVGPCTDTDHSGELYATGTTSWRFQASDLAETGTRSSVYKIFIDADMATVDGDTFEYINRFHVNTRCHVDDNGPACLFDRYFIR